MIACRVVVHGRVQGVGYRYAMVDAAATIGVTGWVRNRRDGTVEAFVQGDEDAVEAMVAWCRRGPPMGKVEDVETYPVASDPAATEFTHLPTV
jgi:acylphosphatase